MAVRGACELATDGLREAPGRREIGNRPGHGVSAEGVPTYDRWMGQEPGGAGTAEPCYTLWAYSIIGYVKV